MVSYRSLAAKEWLNKGFGFRVYGLWLMGFVLVLVSVEFHWGLIRFLGLAKGLSGDT